MLMNYAFSWFYVAIGKLFVLAFIRLTRRVFRGAVCEKVCLS